MNILALVFHPTAVIDPLDATWIASGFVAGVIATVVTMRIKHRAK